MFNGVYVCREDHPELIEVKKKSDLPEKPKTPQQLWYNHEKKTYMKLHPEVRTLPHTRVCVCVLIMYNIYNVCVCVCISV